MANPPESQPLAQAPLREMIVQLGDPQEAVRKLSSEKIWRQRRRSAWRLFRVLAFLGILGAGTYQGCSRGCNYVCGDRNTHTWKHSE